MLSICWYNFVRVVAIYPAQSPLNQSPHPYLRSSHCTQLDGLREMITAPRPPHRNSNINGYGCNASVDRLRHSISAARTPTANPNNNNRSVSGSVASLLRASGGDFVAPAMPKGSANLKLFPPGSMGLPRGNGGASSARSHSGSSSGVAAVAAVASQARHVPGGKALVGSRRHSVSGGAWTAGGSVGAGRAPSHELSASPVGRTGE